MLVVRQILSSKRFIWLSPSSQCPAQHVRNRVKLGRTKSVRVTAQKVGSKWNYYSSCQVDIDNNKLKWLSSRGPCGRGEEKGKFRLRKWPSPKKHKRWWRRTESLLWNVVLLNQIPHRHHWLPHRKLFYGFGSRRRSFLRKPGPVI